VIPADIVPTEATSPSSAPEKARFAVALTLIAAGVVLNFAWIGAVLWTAGRALGHLVS
jgi:hypothetical protein